MKLTIVGGGGFRVPLVYTALLGLRPHRDEHKIQWLGRQGQPEYLPVFRKVFRRDSRGLQRPCAGYDFVVQ